MIGILNAYHFDPTPGNYQEDYSVLMFDFVKKCFPKDEIRNFDIGLGDWPTSVEQCKVWLITGSAKSAYDKDPWILQLQQFIRDLHKSQKKLVGVCFGHQIIALSLEGKVEKSPKGWGVGVRSFDITQNEAWMEPAKKQLHLLFSHQDQVVQLPKSAKLLAQDSFCPIQMYQIGKNILCFQGHPEFSVQFARERLDSRKDLVSKQVYDTAVSSYTHADDRDVLVRWVQNFSALS